MLKLNFLTAVFIVIVVFSKNNFVSAFNLSPVPNFIIKAPNFTTYLKQTRSSYFGYTIVLRDKSIIISAPRAQSVLAAQAHINETGAIYRCPLKQSHEQNIVCNPFVIEPSSNLYFTDRRMNEVRDFQWLGGAMDGGSKDSDPLLICAPRFDGSERIQEETYDYMHGICYRVAHSLSGKLEQRDIQRIKPFPFESQIALNSNEQELIYAYQMGQLGFSAHITANNKENIMGAPGVHNWRGTVVRYRTGSQFIDIPAGFSENVLTYTGYAVASGYLHSAYRNELFYVASSPRDNMEIGLIYIYQYASALDRVINIYKKIFGTQYGEYYGYAALVVDVNGDQLDDIIISAPLYSIDDTIDIGAIYVYINSGNLAFRRQIIEAPFQTEARFGTTITSLGDINNDGFNDIAVGAPLFEGKGAVVIYLGSRDGLQQKPSQILSLSSEFNPSFGYFGHGLSKGVDIDGNGYNDLAIGAPNNEAVYIYYSYPIVKVTTSISTSDQHIDLNTETIEYQVCYRVDNDLRAELLLQLSADPELKRVRFNDNNEFSIQQKFIAEKFQKCQIFKASIADVPSQVFVPIRTILSFQLLNDGSKHFKREYCSNCVVMDPRLSTNKTLAIKYKHGCATDVCNVDLFIESYDVPTEITVGNSTILTMKYNILNSGERAFDSLISIRSTPRLPYARVPPECFQNMDGEMVCEISKGLKYLENRATFETSFDLSNIRQADEIEITAKVMSTGNELNPNDNTITNKIKLNQFSILKVVSSLLNENVKFSNNEDDELLAVYTYSLNNFGPSPLRNVNIGFNVPVTYLEDSSTEIPFINITQVELSGLLEGDELTNSKFEMMPKADNGTEQKFDLEAFRLPVNRTLVQYCAGGNTLCAGSLLNLPLLAKDQSLTLRFGFILKSETIKSVLEKKFTDLALFVHITADLVDSPNGVVYVVDETTPIVVEYRVKPVTPLWIYIVAIVGGLFLLALLTFSLWKFGFFKRQTKDDMEELLNAKLEKQQAKVDTEASVGNSNNVEDI